MCIDFTTDSTSFQFEQALLSQPPTHKNLDILQIRKCIQKIETTLPGMSSSLRLLARITSYDVRDAKNLLSSTRGPDVNIVTMVTHRISSGIYSICLFQKELYRSVTKGDN